MSKQVAGVLRAAADLIEPEGRWIQRDFARNKRGQNKGLSEFLGPAVCWCAIGAIINASDRNDFLDIFAQEAMIELVGPIADWNDAPNRTQAEVVAKLREAANLAEAQA